MKRLPIRNIVNFNKELKDLDQNTMIERKSLVIDLNQVANEESEDIFTGIISRPSVDTDGDIIDPEGVDTSIYNGALMFNHNLNGLPIGEVFDYEINKDGVIGKFRFSKTYDFAVDIKNLVKEKILKAISIGFIPTKALKAGTAAFDAYAKMKGWDVTNVKRIITEALWIETSIVPVGAHPAALMVYAKSFTSELTAKALKIEIGEEQIDESDITITTEDIPESTDTVIPTEPTTAIVETVQTEENSEEKPEEVKNCAEEHQEEPVVEIEVEAVKPLIKFKDLGTKRSQISDLSVKAIKTLRGMQV